ncbi:unnamed protein product [Spirodela intermedia]|uniref:Uncharacterized protein n=1 Tax=Spirodela intermedia TaxID=51605 RepID=A0A7I8JQP2_SPIIN|nr:unnamed protein product [Spirodela intermedia]CAA6671752.1 unnamed protein product [Spirodela intermedia]
MSGGTPVGSGGHVRHRHSQGIPVKWGRFGGRRLFQAAAFAGDRPGKTWTRVLENILWIASAAFHRSTLVDWHSELIYVCDVCDDRIKRTPLYIGLASILLNVGVIWYTGVPVRSLKKASEKLELPPSSAPLVALVGVLSFSLISYGFPLPPKFYYFQDLLCLVPIWSFLTLPLLFTLFMASMVILTYLPIRPLGPQAFALHADRILPL